MPSYFPSGKRRGRPPGSKNSHPPRRGRGRGRSRGRGGRGSRGGRWGARKRARSDEDEQEDYGEEEHFDGATAAEISPVPSYYRDQVRRCVQAPLELPSSCHVRK